MAMMMNNPQAPQVAAAPRPQPAPAQAGIGALSQSRSLTQAAQARSGMQMQQPVNPQAAALRARVDQQTAANMTRFQNPMLQAQNGQSYAQALQQQQQRQQPGFMQQQGNFQQRPPPPPMAAPQAAPQQNGGLPQSFLRGLQNPQQFQAPAAQAPPPQAPTPPPQAMPAPAQNALQQGNALNAGASYGAALSNQQRQAALAAMGAM